MTFPLEYGDKGEPFAAEVKDQGASEPSETPLDLNAICDEFLNVCGPCDYGAPTGCTHSDRDYRPTMLQLVLEVERLRALS
jgi:hypothetical protein